MEFNNRRFTLDRIESGHTFIGLIDMGMGSFLKKKLRLANVKCHDPGTPQGNESIAFVKDRIEQSDIVIKFLEDRFCKWATVLVVLYYKGKDGRLINLNDEIVEYEMAIDTRNVASGEYSANKKMGS